MSIATKTLSHEHGTDHDDHHQPTHNFPWDGHEPHAYPQVREPKLHAHPYHPDLHYDQEH
ncbi:MAG: hypothetical protein ABIP02_07905 [Arenimonas sp.]